ncbi:class I SAM-dependent methyltransferase [Nocardia transvalensis]|uniref:class I SAM-dependent methyltransferase n=1 Tax=Nocardia transvalensis TaxID=37333 RepID=UPI0018956B17|nr:class I SAM-dependent methyltransferase [Nocardia transvalensis]MBF6327723.1 methyltransferase domain-containing protein [Nocardia transvalensis]
MTDDHGYREQVSRNRLRFATIAQSYAEGQGRRLDAELLARMIRPLNVEHVLDVATGTAAAAAVAAQAGPRTTIVGVDSSVEMLRQARAGGGGSAVRLVVALVEELPFAAGAFDLVMCTRALHHIQRPDIAVAEMARVVRPGGHLIVADNVTGLSGDAHSRVEEIQRVRDPGHASTLSESRIVELLRDNSLEVVECHRTTSYRPLQQWLDDGGAGPQEAAEVRRKVKALGPIDDGGSFGTTFVAEAGEVVGLRQAMSWIRAERRSGRRSIVGR